MKNRRKSDETIVGARIGIGEGKLQHKIRNADREMEGTDCENFAAWQKGCRMNNDSKSIFMYMQVYTFICFHINIYAGQVRNLADEKAYTCGYRKMHMNMDAFIYIYMQAFPEAYHTDLTC